jgi:hypothetical protein
VWRDSDGFADDAAVRALLQGDSRRRDGTRVNRRGQSIDKPKREGDAIA